MDKSLQSTPAGAADHENSRAPSRRDQELVEKLLPVSPGRAVSCRALPLLGFNEFRRSLLECARQGGAVVHFFAYQDPSGDRRLFAVMRLDNQLLAAASPAPDEYPALTPEAARFHLFEREIAEQYGIRPVGHPWLKPVRYHANYQGGPDLFGNDYTVDIPGNYPYFGVDGEEIHEVAVGPVHAGIIEPGHFRFQCIGEKVLHLEIQHGWQHRGVERLLTACPPDRRPVIVEGIAGDSVIGNSICFCQCMEALAGREIDAGADHLRAVALELERLANHVGDLGALSGDVAFNPPAAYLGRIRGEFLNLLLAISGNRFGKGLVRPGGVAWPLSEENRSLIQARIHQLRPGIRQVRNLLFSAHTVLARFETTGRVDRQTAAELGLVGVAGRASGLKYDVRNVFPAPCCRDLPPCRYKRTTGDVYCRAQVRNKEIFHSLDLIEALLAKMPPADGRPETAAPALAPDSLAVSLQEGWRGELAHCIITGPDGNILRYKVKDPSFHNWSGLAMALRGEEISDFPLCNKSFNLSYCGFDL